MYSISLFSSKLADAKGYHGNFPGIAPCGVVVFISGVSVDEDDDEGDNVFDAPVVIDVIVPAGVMEVFAGDGEEIVFGIPHSRDSVPLICVSPGLHIGFGAGTTWA